MQTFLPYADYRRSAACLDRQRLGKQRVEVLQMLGALFGLRDGWRNHPATKMWEDHIPSLAKYGLAVCDEWIGRGYKDTCREKILAFQTMALEEGYSMDDPPWLGDEEFHASHRSNLLRKSPEHYSRFGWSEPTTLPYVWPVTEVK